MSAAGIGVLENDVRRDPLAVVMDTLVPEGAVWRQVAMFGGWHDGGQIFLLRHDGKVVGWVHCVDSPDGSRVAVRLDGEGNELVKVCAQW